MKCLKLLADTPLRHLPLTLALTLILTLNNNPIPNFSNPTNPNPKPYFLLHKQYVLRKRK